MGDVQRRVVMVVFDGFQLLDLAGPADVFAAVGLLRRRSGYRVEVTAPHAGPVSAQNGLTTVVPVALPDVTGPIDTLLVTGGWSVPQQLSCRPLIDGIARLAAGARRVTSVCNGAFLLAEAGLLAGRRATTHWLVSDELRSRYPDVRVDADQIYVRDGRVWTSAGVSAGVDLALALVAADHGHELARDVARGLVVYLHRPGGQSQFSTPMRAAAPSSEPFRQLLAFIDAHPTEDLSVPALARRIGMSERVRRVDAERIEPADQIGKDCGQHEHKHEAKADGAKHVALGQECELAPALRRAGAGSP